MFWLSSFGPLTRASADYDHDANNQKETHDGDAQNDPVGLEMIWDFCLRLFAW